MKAMPPSLARAMAIFSPETACITAETMGIFMVRAALLPLAVLHQRGLEADVGGDALRGGIAGHQQILAESVGGFLEVESHSVTSILY